jgi:NCS1 family nucleobase:cation symporter-1
MIRQYNEVILLSC